MLKIITDSTSEITQEEAAALGIEVIPITIVFGENAYLEGVELSKDEFYARLLSGKFPHTAQPSPAQFTEAYERTNGEETLVLLISSALSGSTDCARIAARDFPNVHVYETLCTTAMLRYLVEAAVANREKTMGQVIAILDELRPRLRLYACVDTLEYLYKGGRVKRSVAFVGNLLGIKPIVTVTDDGRVELIGKAHGQKRALKALAEHYNHDQVDHDYPVYFLQTNTDIPARQVMGATGNEDARVFRICCAVGTHIGPDAAGIVYVVKPQ